MTASATIPFTKMNGLGNEIVVVDLRASGKVFTATEVEAIAADRTSRFDQMMVLHAPKTKGTEVLRPDLQRRRLGSWRLRQWHALRRLAVVSGAGAADVQG